jgi:hypothetical protein
VDTQFSTSNTSFHPVKGAQNNTFCDTDTMESPWTGGNTMTCFDCHNATTELTYGTTAAHGGSNNLRAAVLAGAKGTVTALCVECHKASVYWSTNIHGGTGSAYSGEVNSRHQTGDHWGCTECHGNAAFGADVATRADRAINSHGFNTAGEYSFLRSISSGAGWTWAGTWDSCNDTPTAMCSYSGGGVTGGVDEGSYAPGGSY